MPFHKTIQNNHNERGNVLLIVFFAVVLVAALTAAIQGSNRSETAGIDDETLIIRVSEVQRYAGELERAVLFVIRNGYSESDIRFAHPNNHPDYGDLPDDDDPSDQVFHPAGGGALYRDPPSGINDGSAWEFYGGTHAPAIASDKAELVAVLPNVTQAFCDAVNRANGQNGIPADTGASSASGSSPGDCVNLGPAGRFDDVRQFFDGPNVMDEETFEQDPNISEVKPAPQACVSCTISGGSRHFYHVLLAR